MSMLLFEYALPLRDVAELNRHMRRRDRTITNMVIYHEKTCSVYFFGIFFSMRANV